MNIEKIEALARELTFIISGDNDSEWECYLDLATHVEAMLIEARLEELTWFEEQRDYFCEPEDEEKLQGRIEELTQQLNALKEGE